MEMLIYAVIMLAMSYAVSSYMISKMDTQVTTAGELDVPTAEEGGNVPVCFGETIISSSNVIWYGDAGVKPIKSKGGKK